MVFSISICKVSILVSKIILAFVIRIRAKLLFFLSYMYFSKLSYLFFFFIYFFSLFFTFELYFSSVKFQKQTGFPEAADVTARLQGSRIHYRAGFRCHRLLRPHLYRR